MTKLATDFRLGIKCRGLMSNFRSEGHKEMRKKETLVTILFFKTLNNFFWQKGGFLKLCFNGHEP